MRRFTLPLAVTVLCVVAPSHVCTLEVQVILVEQVMPEQAGACHAAVAACVSAHSPAHTAAAPVRAAHLTCNPVRLLGVLDDKLQVCTVQQG